jgi:hypothetical protein
VNSLTSEFIPRFDMSTDLSGPWLIAMIADAILAIAGILWPLVEAIRQAGPFSSPRPPVSPKKTRKPRSRLSHKRLPGPAPTRFQSEGQYTIPLWYQDPLTL